MKYIALHHTAVSSSSPQLYGVNRYHQGKWNMKSTMGWFVGYNYFVERSGQRTQTRMVGEETIANMGHNCDEEVRCDTISYCMAGDFNVERPTVEQEQDFKKFVDEAREKFPAIKVVGHRDLQVNRTCPGGQITDKDFTRWNTIEGIEDTCKTEMAEQQKLIDILLALIVRLLDRIK